MVSRIFLALSILTLAACGGGSEESDGFYPLPYMLQNTSEICVEYTPSSQAEQDQIQSQGWYQGSCSRSNYLGVCEQQYEDSGFYVSAVYYPDDSGLLTTDLLRQSCSVSQGRFIEGNLDTSQETSGDITRTFIIQENSIACTEYVGDTQASHNHIEMSGGVEGMCSRDLALGVCEKPDNGVGFRSNTVYYPDDAGLRTAESLVSGCEHLNGTFIYGSDGTTPDPDTTPDVTPPVLSEITGVGRTIDLTPTYTFNSTEAGQITWMGGSCTAETTLAIAGENVIELSALTAGEYDNCEFTVTDNSANQSGPLILSNFTVITPDSDFDGFADFIEVEYATDPLNADSNPMAILANAVDFTDDNDSDGFSDELEAWYYTNPNHADSKPVDLDGDFIPDDFDASNDTDAPKLLGFDIVESAINIQTGNETVTFNLTVVDDISGVKQIGIVLRSPSNQSVYVSLYAESLGGLTHSVSLQSSKFGEFAEAGIWKIDFVSIEDVAGNHFSLSANGLAELGFESQISVTNDNSDTQAPSLTDFSIVEDEINITNGTENITFNVTVEDDVSGVKQIGIVLRSPSNHSVYVSLYAESLGGLTHSVSLQSSAFGEFAEAGIWKIDFVSVEDVAGNHFSLSANGLAELGFESQISVTNDNSDTQAPSLTDFSIVEDEINITNGTENITFNVTVEDDVSGVKQIGIVLRSPSNHSVYVSLYAESLGGLTHSVSLQSSAFGEFAEAGIWKIDFVSVEDVAGNHFSLSANGLAELGFESQVIVTN